MEPERELAQLVWHLYVNCPKCGSRIDLAEHDEEGQYSTPIFNNDWDSLAGEGVDCPDCTHQFELSGAEY